MGVEDAAEIRRLLGYKDGTAGGMMTQFVSVPKTATVADTIEVLRALPRGSSDGALRVHHRRGTASCSA